MAYSTGSGTGADFLDAIISHAVADGWVEDGGVGTGFPIRKNGLFINMGTFTVSVTDLTALASTARTVTLGSMGIGLNAADALTNRNNTTNRIRLFEFSYGVNEWHIFSDPGGNYVHWSFRFANLFYPEVWSHGGFGFIDKEGMSHGGIGYGTSSDIPTYITSTSGNVRDYSSAQFGWPWGNRQFRLEWTSSLNIARRASTQYLIFAPQVTIPSTTYPQPGIVYFQGDRLALGMNPGVLVSPYTSLTSGLSGNSGAGMCWIGQGARNNPFLGSLTLAPAPFVILPSNADDSSLVGMYAGSYPGVRACNIENISSGGEVSFMGDTWKIFPLFRRTDPTRLTNTDREFTSGTFGIAHRKHDV